MFPPVSQPVKQRLDSDRIRSCSPFPRVKAPLLGMQIVSAVPQSQTVSALPQTQSTPQTLTQLPQSNPNIPHPQSPMMSPRPTGTAEPVSGASPHPTGSLKTGNFYVRRSPGFRTTPHNTRGASVDTHLQERSFVGSGLLKSSPFGGQLPQSGGHLLKSGQRPQSDQYLLNQAKSSYPNDKLQNEPQQPPHVGGTGEFIYTEEENSGNMNEIPSVNDAHAPSPMVMQRPIGTSLWKTRSGGGGSGGGIRFQGLNQGALNQGLKQSVQKGTFPKGGVLGFVSPRFGGPPAGGVSGEGVPAGPPRPPQAVRNLGPGQSPQQSAANQSGIMAEASPMPKGNPSRIEGCRPLSHSPMPMRTGLKAGHNIPSTVGLGGNLLSNMNIPRTGSSSGPLNNSGPVSGNFTGSMTPGYFPSSGPLQNSLMQSNAPVQSSNVTPLHNVTPLESSTIQERNANMYETQQPTQSSQRGDGPSTYPKLSLKEKQSLNITQPLHEVQKVEVVPTSRTGPTTTKKASPQGGQQRSNNSNTGVPVSARGARKNESKNQNEDSSEVTHSKATTTSSRSCVGGGSLGSRASKNGVVRRVSPKVNACNGPANGRSNGTATVGLPSTYNKNAPAVKKPDSRKVDSSDNINDTVGNVNRSVGLGIKKEGGALSSQTGRGPILAPSSGNSLSNPKATASTDPASTTGSLRWVHSATNSMSNSMNSINLQKSTDNGMVLTSAHGSEHLQTTHLRTRPINLFPNSQPSRWIHEVQKVPVVQDGQQKQANVPQTVGNNGKNSSGGNNTAVNSYGGNNNSNSLSNGDRMLTNSSGIGGRNSGNVLEATPANTSIGLHSALFSNASNAKSERKDNVVNMSSHSIASPLTTLAKSKVMGIMNTQAVQYGGNCNLFSPLSVSMPFNRNSDFHRDSNYSLGPTVLRNNNNSMLHGQGLSDSQIGGVVQNNAGNPVNMTVPASHICKFNDSPEDKNLKVENQKLWEHVTHQDEQIQRLTQLVNGMMKDKAGGTPSEMPSSVPSNSKKMTESGTAQSKKSPEPKKATTRGTTGQSQNQSQSSTGSTAQNNTNNTVSQNESRLKTIPARISNVSHRRTVHGTMHKTFSEQTTAPGNQSLQNRNPNNITANPRWSSASTIPRAGTAITQSSVELSQDLESEALAVTEDDALTHDQSRRRNQIPAEPSFHGKGDDRDTTRMYDRDTSTVNENNTTRLNDKESGRGETVMNESVNVTQPNLTLNRHYFEVKSQQYQDQHFPFSSNPVAGGLSVGGSQVSGSVLGGLSIGGSDLGRSPIGAYRLPASANLNPQQHRWGSFHPNSSGVPASSPCGINPSLLLSGATSGGGNVSSGMLSNPKLISPVRTSDFKTSAEETTPRMISALNDKNYTTYRKQSAETLTPGQLSAVTTVLGEQQLSLEQRLGGGEKDFTRGSISPRDIIPPEVPEEDSYSPGEVLTNKRSMTKESEARRKSDDDRQKNDADRRKNEVDRVPWRSTASKDLPSSNAHSKSNAATSSNTLSRGTSYDPRRERIPFPMRDTRLVPGAAYESEVHLTMVDTINNTIDNVLSSVFFPVNDTPADDYPAVKDYPPVNDTPADSNYPFHAKSDTASASPPSYNLDSVPAACSATSRSKEKSFPCSRNNSKDRNHTSRDRYDSNPKGRFEPPERLPSTDKVGSRDRNEPSKDSRSRHNSKDRLRENSRDAKIRAASKDRSLRECSRDGSVRETTRDARLRDNSRDARLRDTSRDTRFPESSRSRQNSQDRARANSKDRYRSNSKERDCSKSKDRYESKYTYADVDSKPAQRVSGSSETEEEKRPSGTYFRTSDGRRKNHGGNVLDRIKQFESMQASEIESARARTNSGARNDGSINRNDGSITRNDGSMNRNDGSITRNDKQLMGSHPSDEEGQDQFAWRLVFDQKYLGKNLATNRMMPSSIRRMRGCRNSVAISPIPLSPHRNAYWFEVQVEETHNAWVGGLGLGLTDSLPDVIPEKAWALMGTIIGGYWGRLFVVGEEFRSDWMADTLRVGDRVGCCYLQRESQFYILVNGEVVLRTSPLLHKNEPILSNRHLYPVIDCFGETVAIKLLNDSEIPPFNSLESATVSETEVVLT